MSRRAFVTGLGALLAAPLAAEAQQTEKTNRIGFLSPYAACPIRPEMMEPLRHGLRAHGYRDGHNIIIECRSAREVGGLPAAAAEFVRLRVDVILALGTPSALAAQQTTKAIPIIMVNVGDAVESGLVTSLARPGGNVTGLSVLTPDLGPKVLQVLKDAAPAVSRVAIWIDPTNPGQTLGVRQMDGVAKTLAVTLDRIELRAGDKLEAVFATTLRQRDEALIVFPLPITQGRDVRRIAEFGVRNRLPTIAFLPDYVRDGLLISYGPNQAEQYRRAGRYIDKLLKGAKPADLPIEQPTQFDLVINLKTAKALGLTIPRSLLLRADQLIE